MRKNDKVIVRKGFFKRDKIEGKIIDIEQAEEVDFGHQDSDVYTLKLDNGEVIRVEYPNYFGKYDIIGLA